MNRDHIINRFATELTKAAGAAFQAHASSRAGTAPQGSGLLVSVTSREADYGTLLVFFPDATVDALVRLAPNGSQTDADEPGPTETTRRLCAQTAAALDRRAPQCDLQIVTHFVSREHARFTLSAGTTLIEDLGSRNGVFVNSVRVDRRRLQQGDVVTIGETQFRFVESMAH